MHTNDWGSRANDCGDLYALLVVFAGRPPRGWRSWNLYGNNVNQTLITGIMDGMVKKQTFGGGKPTSLCDLGYCDVGLDDHWQMCGSPDAAPGMHYHDKDGNPIVNKKVFPDLKAMADHAHSLKLTSGWCKCVHEFILPQATCGQGSGLAAGNAGWHAS